MVGYVLFQLHFFWFFFSSGYPWPQLPLRPTGATRFLSCLSCFLVRFNSLFIISTLLIFNILCHPVYLFCSIWVCLFFSLLPLPLCSCWPLLCNLNQYSLPVRCVNSIIPPPPPCIFGPWLNVWLACIISISWCMYWLADSWLDVLLRTALFD